MSEQNADLLITLSLPDGDAEDLDELTRELKSEIGDLSVESVEDVSAGPAPAGTKAADFAVLGQMIVTLAPAVIPPLFDFLKSWTERKPALPVKIRVRVGKRTAQVEYDPTTTTADDLEALIKTLGRSVKV